MNKMFSLSSAAFELFSNVFTVVGGCIGLFAIAHPETIADYLGRIDRNVDVIAESIPLWPVVEAISVDFSPPVRANFSINIANPKNLVVDDFVIKAVFDLNDEDKIVPLEGPVLLPPNESVRYQANIIRTPWFMQTLEGQFVGVLFCISGSIEGREDTFYETRKYTFSISTGTATLKDRTFSFQPPNICAS